MLGRALSLATVTLLIGGMAAQGALAQENLEAGKSPSQIFAGTCAACHKSPRGLLRTVSSGSLSSFLRQHYTTSPTMAGVLASYLVSNGAGDTRSGAGGAKQSGSPDQPDHPGRRQQHGVTASQEQPKGDGRPAAEGQVPAQAAVERGPDGRKLTQRQKLSKQSKPASEEPGRGEERAKTEELPATEEPGGEALKQTATKDTGDGKSEGAKPSEAPSETARLEPPAEAPSLRADPVPPVTPAPATPLSPADTVSAAIGNPADAPAVPLPSAPAPPPTPTAAAPALPPVSPAGPPAPPISQ